MRHCKIAIGLPLLGEGGRASDITGMTESNPIRDMAWAPSRRSPPLAGARSRSVRPHGGRSRVDEAMPTD
jgi:hypothetical protein